MPRAGTEKFIVPDKIEQAIFGDIVMEINKNQLESAVKAAANYNYEIIKVFDQKDSGAASYVLREHLPITKGWGLYIFRAEPANDIVIEAPHPLADINTENVALDLYRALNAKALLIAGAHRNTNKNGSSDSAHAAESIFQTVHLTLYKPTGQPDNKTMFLQVHGFSAHEHPHYPRMVIGHNWANDPERNLILLKLADTLQKNKIKVGICDGKHYKDLCGTENIQSSVMDGGIFIHLELNETLRRRDTALVNSLKQVFNP